MTEKGRGGDVKITQQKGAKTEIDSLEIRAGVGAGTAPGGDIFFVQGDGTEAFRIKSDGTVLIRDEKCTHDKELYDAMRAFFTNAKTEYP